jgi:hypothetical protein
VQFKVTEDSGPVGAQLIRGRKDRVYAVGLEVDHMF